MSGKRELTLHVATPPHVRYNTPPSSLSEDKPRHDKQGLNDVEGTARTRDTNWPNISKASTTSCDNIDCSPYDILSGAEQSKPTNVWDNDDTTAFFQQLSLYGWDTVSLSDLTTLNEESRPSDSDEKINNLQLPAKRFPSGGYKPAACTFMNVQDFSLWQFNSKTMNLHKQYSLSKSMPSLPTCDTKLPASDDLISHYKNNGCSSKARRTELEHLKAGQLFLKGPEAASFLGYATMLAIVYDELQLSTRRNAVMEELVDGYRRFFLPVDRQSWTTDDYLNAARPASDFVVCPQPRDEHCVCDQLSRLTYAFRPHTDVYSIEVLYARMIACSIESFDPLTALRRLLEIANFCTERREHDRSIKYFESIIEVCEDTQPHLPETLLTEFLTSMTNQSGHSGSRSVVPLLNRLRQFILQQRGTADYSVSSLLLLGTTYCALNERTERDSTIASIELQLQT